MKKLILLFLILNLIFSIPAFAADFAVRAPADCANNGDGTDWGCAASPGATGAYDGLPATLDRAGSSTYYMGDGTYEPYIFDDAESGANYITIIKAVESAHGPAGNWASSYGDGQSIFTGPTVNALRAVIKFTTGYWIWDGVTGSGKVESTYGFKFVVDDPNEHNYLIALPGIGDDVQIDHIQVSHTAFIQPGDAYDYKQIAFYSNPITYGAHDITVSNNFFDSGNVQMQLRNLNNGSELSNTVIEDNYFYNNWSSSANHGGMIVPGNGCYDVTIKNNTFDNPRVYCVDWHKNGDAGAVGNSGWDIFNNIVIGGANTMTSVWGNGDSGSDNVV